MSSLSTLLLVTALSTGQADAQATFDNWSDFMVGAWTGTTEDGERQLHHYRSMYGGKFVAFRSVSGDSSMEAIIGIDPSTHQVTWWGFSSDGGTSISRIESADDANWHWKGTIYDGEGNKTTGVWHASKDGDHKLTGQATLTVDGEELPPTSGTWKRVSQELALPVIAGPAPTEVPAAMAPMARVVGRHREHGKLVDGNHFSGSAISRWVLDGKFLLYRTVVIDEKQKISRYMSISGVDPTTKKVTGWEFTSEGGVGKFVVDADGLRLQGKALLPDGPLTYRGTFEVGSGSTVLKYTGEPQNGGDTYYAIWEKYPE